MHNQVFLNIAKEFTKLSKCQSHQVCALFVKDNRIISTGINGSPAGLANCNDLFPDKNQIHENKEIRSSHHVFSDSFEIHAEMNGILFAALNGINLTGCEVYCTIIPCLNCLKHLVALKIKKIYYLDTYDFPDYTDQEKYYYNLLIEESKIGLIQI